MSTTQGGLQCIEVYDPKSHKCFYYRVWVSAIEGCSLPKWCFTAVVLLTFLQSQFVE